MRAPCRVLLACCIIFLATASSAWPDTKPGISHTACVNCHTVLPAPDHEDCVGCHDGSYNDGLALTNPPLNVMAESGRPVRHLQNASNPNSSCRACHDSKGVMDSDGVLYPRLLQSEDTSGNVARSGNQFCYNCHSTGTALPSVSSQRFSASAHDDARLDPPSGTQVRCSACHEPHGSDFEGLTRASEESLCFGSNGTCHSSEEDSARGIDIKNLFTASSDTFAHHNMTAEDQASVTQVVAKDPDASRKWPSVPASKLECSNCHDVHSNNAHEKTVDPYETTVLDDSVAVDPLHLINKARGKSANCGSRLTDGLVRGTPVQIDTGSYGETVNMILDLGAATPISKMVAYVGPVEGPNVRSVTFGTSINGVEYATHDTVTYVGYDPRAFSARFPTTSARYLRFTIYRPYIEPGEEQWNINKYWVGELEAYDTGSGPLIRDVSSNCLACHSGTVPSGVSLSEKTRFWIATANGTDRILSGLRRVDWNNEFHGSRDGIGGIVNTADTLKSPYRRGMEALQCTTCHDEHGSGNVFHLKESVNGKSGIRVKSFRGKDAAGFCSACHNVNLLSGPNHCYGCHTTGTGCFDCHYHGVPTVRHGKSGGL